MEKRTPVQTISSVMLNSPRQVFSPQRIDRSVNRKTPISQAVSSTVAPSKGATSRPVAPITSTTKAPVAAKTATTIRPASPAVKSSGSTPATTKTPAATKPITSTTTKPAVNPITSKTNSPAATRPSGSSSSGITSMLNNPIAKTLIGAGAGALAGKIFGSPTTGGTKTTTGGSSPVIKPTTGGTTPVTKPTTGGTPSRGLGTTTGDKPLTEEQIQAELDKVKASEEPIMPDGAVANEDGTYTVTNNGIVSIYDANGTLIETKAEEPSGGGARSLVGGKTGVDETQDTLLSGGDVGYYQDADGNIYDGQGNLLYSLGSNGEYFDVNGDLIYDPNADTGSDTVVAEETWTDPETNQTWTLGADGNWTTEDVGSPDITVSDNTDYTDYVDVPEENAKDGGYIGMATGGKIKGYAAGDSVYSDTTEEVQPWQNVDYNYSDNTLTGDNSLYSGTSYNPTYTDLTASPASSSAPDVIDNGDGTSSYWDGNDYVTVDNNTGAELSRSNMSEAEPVQTDSAISVTTDDEGNTTITDANGRVTVFDSQGNVIPVGGGRAAVTSAGSGNKPSFLSQVANAVTGQGGQNQSGVLDALKGYITQNPGLAGGAIGALLASMMSSSGDSGSSGHAPVDISQLAGFAPRTTDFGPGMTGGRTGTGSPIVSYQDYSQGYGADVPDERLYADLGISGWLNEPNMTDYVDQNGNPVDQYGNALEAETPQENAAEPAEEPTMASGGPTTHYTFGRVIDPAQNLGIGQGMKKGGLSQAHTVHSHHTNPVIDDRIDFRKGSAVNGAGDGQSDDIPAWLADGEYVIDAELVSMLGNGSNKAGAKVLDDFREAVRSHKRSAPLNKIPPKAKSPLNYLKEAMNG
jgi:hypothetical protein